MITYLFQCILLSKKIFKVNERKGANVLIKFGTGGWRAIIGEEFTKDNLQMLCSAVAQKMIDEKCTGSGVVIGYDRRFLSDLSAKWAAEVFSSHGIRCMIIDGEAPTPMIMFAVKEYECHYGIAVTASHNPAHYNGIKVFTKGGRDADTEVTKSIEEYIERQRKAPENISFDEALEKGLAEYIRPRNDYIDSIIGSINMESIRKKNLHIIIDPMYGVSKTSLQTIFMTARCDVDVIHERHDTLFGGRLPSPNAHTLNALQAYVNDSKADIGIATDGDADRIGVIDDSGSFLHPNTILVLLYYYLIKYKGWKGSAVRNTATTHLLDKIAKSCGEKCYEVPVGFKHISSKMIETDAIIGGESSGGLTVRGHIQGKDGIYAAALLVEMIAVTGISLSRIFKEITDEFGEHHLTELDFSFSQAKKEELTDLLFAQKKLPEFPFEMERVSYLDGCKVCFKNGGWIICRFSGTEPLIRVFCEMNSAESAESVTKTMTDFLGLVL